MSQQQSDYDGAWKEALEHYLSEFVAFFFPEAHAAIDWSRGYEFLDKELQQVTRDADLGQRRVDKLVQVWREEGEPAWVLVHVEVQSQREADFAERMYVYNYRLFDRYHRLVASLAVLGDESATWRPERFGYDLWGCSVAFRFPVVKLLDYRAQWSALEVSDNPFATIVMVHLKAQETRGDDEARQRWKLSLTRRLYERGYGREDVLRLFRFIDWVMQLPEGLEESYWRELRAYEEVEGMSYVTSVERIGIKQGIQQGIQQGMQQGLLAGIELGLELRFGSEGLRLVPEVYKIEDVDVLRAIHAGLRTAGTLDELRRIYAPF